MPSKACLECLKKASDNLICPISVVPVLCGVWSMIALPLIQMDFLIFPYMSSEFQFSHVCKQQRALNHLTKCQKGFALNVKTVVTPYTQMYAYLHGTSSSYMQMEMTILLWTRNMQTGLTPAFSFSSSFSTWIKSQLLVKIEEKQACELECGEEQSIICAFRIC